MSPLRVVGVLSRFSCNWVGGPNNPFGYFRGRWGGDNISIAELYTIELIISIFTFHVNKDFRYTGLLY